MIEYFDAVEIHTFVSGKRTDLLFVTDDGDLRNAVTCAHLGRVERTRVFAFRESNVLKIGGSPRRMVSRIISVWFDVRGSWFVVRRIYAA